MKLLSSFLSWLDEHILIILAGFLLAFIPLYPKLPLFDVIPGYIVRVRLEDFFIFLTAGIWLVQVIRRKIEWRSPVTFVIAAYAIAGLLSTISAVLVTKTVPNELLHIGKTLLHYFRYLEYFSLFAILYSSIKKAAHVKVLLGIIAVTVLLIAIYGYGQRYFYWPVYSTMNREFSKGLRLYLTEHARVQSTFGGHYDLAAYLVITLPLIMALAINATKRWLKLGLQVIHWLGVWLLIVSASRTSFIAYILGVSLVIFLYAIQKPTIPKKITWGVSRLAFMGVLTSVMMLKFGDDMYERLLQVLEGYPQAYEAYQDFDRQRVLFINDQLPVLVGLKKLPSMPAAEKPANAISTDEAIALEGNVLVPSDERPTTEKPSDVYVDVPDIVEVATISASGSPTTVLVDKGPRVYSDCALTKGLSLCIRTETLWPRAMAGFYTNPLLGSGYATLTKETVGQFTEAESTDNNFLRTLGETGLLGFITFYGVIVVALWLVRKDIFSSDPLARTLSIGLVAASAGLLLNAVYIDVFAASKVAQSYWALVGLCLGYLHLQRNRTATPILAELEAEPVTNNLPANPKRAERSKTKRKKRRA